MLGNDKSSAKLWLATPETIVARKNNKKRSSRRNNARSHPGGLKITRILKTFVAVSAVGAIVLGIIHWDRFIKQSASASDEFVTLKIRPGVPEWVTGQLRERLTAAATADGRGMRLDDEAARRVQQNIQTLFAWLKDVRVRTMRDHLLVEGRWRMPLVLVKMGLDRFYVDRDLVVLDYVDMPRLPIVKVRGLSAIPAEPLPGRPWRREDLHAAVELVELLKQWDRDKSPDKPLLDEIDAVDVSNYDGREDSRFPHIVLYTTDDTEVIWGAELGKWQRHLEATDAEKVAKLYSYYKQHGSLLGDVKYINLRDPQDRIHLPIDRY